MISLKIRWSMYNILIVVKSINTYGLRLQSHCMRGTYKVTFVHPNKSERGGWIISTLNSISIEYPIYILENNGF